MGSITVPNFAIVTKSKQAYKIIISLHVYFLLKIFQMIQIYCI